MISCTFLSSGNMHNISITLSSMRRNGTCRHSILGFCAYNAYKNESPMFMSPNITPLCCITSRLMLLMNLYFLNGYMAIESSSDDGVVNKSIFRLSGLHPAASMLLK